MVVVLGVLPGADCAAALEVSVLLGACALALDWLLLMSLEVLPGCELAWLLSAGDAALAEAEVSVELLLVEGVAAVLLVDGLLLLALISELVVPADGAEVLPADGLVPAVAAVLLLVEVPVAPGEAEALD